MKKQKEQPPKGFFNGLLNALAFALALYGLIYFSIRVWG